MIKKLIELLGDIQMDYEILSRLAIIDKNLDKSYLEKQYSKIDEFLRNIHTKEDIKFVKFNEEQSERNAEEYSK